MLRRYALALAFVFISALSNAQDSLDDQTRALIARAASLERNTKSVPPPGNPLEHQITTEMDAAIRLTILTTTMMEHQIPLICAPTVSSDGFKLQRMTTIWMAAVMQMKTVTMILTVSPISKIGAIGHNSMLLSTSMVVHHTSGTVMVMVSWMIPINVQAPPMVLT